MVLNKSQRHAFHLVDPSAMPLISAISCLMTTLGSVMFMHGYVGGFQIQFLGIFSILVCMFL